MSPLQTVERGTSAQAITRLLTVLFPDATTALDMTYGAGKFWDGTAPIHVLGVDLNPDRRPQVRADFTRLPFADSSFDVAVFDPPYLSEPSKAGTALVANRFGSYRSEAESRAAVQSGAAEAWRVSRLGIICKVMNHTHRSRFVHMTRWVEDAVPADIYSEMHLISKSKPASHKWTGSQLSLRANHTTFLVFRHDGAVHKRRRVVVTPEAA
jgi:hypothetical protein